MKSTDTAADQAMDDGRYRDLLSLLREEGNERVVLERVVAWLIEALGLEGAAVFMPWDDGFERVVRLGDGSFPEVLGEEADHPSALRIGEGFLLPSPSPLLGEPPPSLIVLADLALRLNLLQRRLKREYFQAKYRGVELEALYDVGLAIAATLDLTQLGEEILLRAVSLLDARRGALYSLDGQQYRLSSTIGGEARRELSAAEVDVGRLSMDDATAIDLALLPGARFLLAVAVEVEFQPRGLLVVGDKESRFGVRAFPESDRRTLALFANQAALALENARLHREALEKERLEREMELAAQIQRQILPKGLPVVPGWELEGWSRPARQVGGDYYDLFCLDEGRLAAVVADVTGKGVPAALLVSTLHSALRLLWPQHGTTEEMLRRLNTHILQWSASNKFITLFLAEVDPETGTLVYLNAGHNPGLLLRRGGEIEELPAGGLPVGLFGLGACRSSTAGLEAGDVLCLYSDGITETLSPREEEFGLQRLADLLVKGRELPLDEVRAVIDRAVCRFSDGRPQGDDQTLVLIRRSGGEPS